MEWDRAESVDLAIVPKMAEIGFFGLTIPEEYGGLGGDYLTYALGMEELGRADSALRGIVSVSTGLVGKSILGFGTEEQKQEWLPQLADGHQARLLRAHRARHRLRRRQPDHPGAPGRRRLRHQRPEALHHQRHLGRRRAGLRPHRRRRARAASRRSWCPTDAPGFEAREIKGKLGLRGQATAELFLDRRAGARPRRCSARRAQGFKIAMTHPRQGPARGGRRLRRHRPGLPGDRGRVRHLPHPVRPADRPASSWCRT